MTRPNGSGEGLAALRKSINPSTDRDLSSPTHRSRAASTSPGRRAVPAPTSPTPATLVYIPFALDAVTTATGPATAVTGADAAVATHITQRRQLHRRRADVALPRLHADHRRRRDVRPEHAAGRWRPADPPLHPAARLRHPQLLGVPRWELQHHHAAAVRARPLGARPRPSRSRSTTARSSRRTRTGSVRSRSHSSSRRATVTTTVVTTWRSTASTASRR